MTSVFPRIFDGIYAATVCPLLVDGAIDEPALARHLHEVSSVGGITGLLINGLAGENFMLTRLAGPAWSRTVRAPR